MVGREHNNKENGNRNGRKNVAKNVWQDIWKLERNIEREVGASKARGVLRSGGGTKFYWMMSNE